MFANFASVTIHDVDAAQRQLDDQFVPMVKGFEGFQRGIWLVDRHAGKGVGVIVFDTREHAEAAAAQVPPSNPGDPVTLDRIETYEIAAEA